MFFYCKDLEWKEISNKDNMDNIAIELKNFCDKNDKTQIEISMAMFHERIDDFLGNSKSLFSNSEERFCYYYLGFIRYIMLNDFKFLIVNDFKFNNSMKEWLERKQIDENVKKEIGLILNTEKSIDLAKKVFHMVNKYYSKNYFKAPKKEFFEIWNEYFPPQNINKNKNNEYFPPQNINKNKNNKLLLFSIAFLIIFLIIILGFIFKDPIKTFFITKNKNKKSIIKI